MDYRTPKYFAFLDGEEKGPFSLADLSDAGVRPSTYVWSKEMADWQRADSVEEIRDYFRGHISSPSPAAPQPIVINPANQNGGYAAPEQQEEKPKSRPRFSRFGISEEDVQMPEPDINTPPQVSMGLAILSFFFFPPTAIAAIIFTRQAEKLWRDSTKATDTNEMNRLRTEAHDKARLSKMWMGISLAIGLIFWTLLFSL